MTDPDLPDHEYLTVRELAGLLRLKERKIYDLAASGAVPYSKATGKLLFPAAEIRAWIDRARSDGRDAKGPSIASRPSIVLGSHDPLLDWAIRQSRCELASYYDGSLDGLKRFVRGEGVIAALHIHDPRTDHWNVPAVSSLAKGQNAVLIAFATRRRGLVFRPGEAAPTGLSDLAGRRVVPRQAESGAESLFVELAEKEGLDLSDVEFTEVARTEDDAVEAVRRHDADATFGLEAVARTYGMDYLPIVEEQFALLIDRKAWFDQPVQKLMTFCTTAQFANRAQAYGGYETSSLGDVLWNA